MKLSDVPQSKIPLIHTPLRSTNRTTNWKLRNGEYPEVVAEIARITGYYGEYVIVPASQAKRRDLAADTLAATGASFSALCNPWYMGTTSGGPAFSLPEDTTTWQMQIGTIRTELSKWRDAGVGDVAKWILYNDEAHFLRDVDPELALLRTVELWIATRDVFPGAVIHWYNARMMRRDGIFPKVHPCTPGPSGCEMYWADHFRNSRELADTVRLSTQLGLEVVPWVQPHSLRRGNKWIRPPGAHWYEDTGHAIRKAGCKSVVINEPYILDDDGNEREWVVDNLAGLVAGLNGS